MWAFGRLAEGHAVQAGTSLPAPESWWPSGWVRGAPQHRVCPLPCLHVGVTPGPASRGGWVRTERSHMRSLAQTSFFWVSSKNTFTLKIPCSSLR